MQNAKHEEQDILSTLALWHRLFYRRIGTNEETSIQLKKLVQECQL